MQRFAAAAKYIHAATQHFKDFFCTAAKAAQTHEK
jgi:hypothetical protein